MAVTSLLVLSATACVGQIYATSGTGAGGNGPIGSGAGPGSTGSGGGGDVMGAGGSSQAGSGAVNVTPSDAPTTFACDATLQPPMD